jgi:hypothetical protein
MKGIVPSPVNSLATIATPISKVISDCSSLLEPTELVVNHAYVASAEA